MKASKVLNSWPLIRQITEGDPLALGKAVQSKRSRMLRPRTEDAETVAKSICPYCAVGCAQLVYVKQGEITHIEGDPASPISRGLVLAQRALRETSRGLPLRAQTVKYRRPYGTKWEELPP